MHRYAIVGILLGGAGLLLDARAQAKDDAAVADALCRDWFGRSAQTSRLALAETNLVVSEVSLDGHPAGWLFRTDQMPPVCKGKRGQIAVLVAIGTDARIKGLSVLAHKEDPNYFKRLKDSFYQQFRNKRVGDDAVTFDAVTKATYSSRAIIRDVVEGSKNVIALPEVAAKLSSANKGG